MPDEYNSDHLFWAPSQKILDLFSRVEADLWAEESIRRGLEAIEGADAEYGKLFATLKEDSKKRETLLNKMKESLVDARPSLVVDAWQSLVIRGRATKEEMLD